MERESGWDLSSSLYLLYQQIKSLPEIHPICNSKKNDSVRELKTFITLFNHSFPVSPHEKNKANSRLKAYIKWIFFLIQSTMDDYIFIEEPEGTILILSWS